MLTGTGFYSQSPEIDDPAYSAGDTCFPKVFRTLTVYFLVIGGAAHGMDEVVGCVDPLKGSQEAWLIETAAFGYFDPVGDCKLDFEFIANKNTDIKPAFLQEKVGEAPAYVTCCTGDKYFGFAGQSHKPPSSGIRERKTLAVKNISTRRSWARRVPQLRTVFAFDRKVVRVEMQIELAVVKYLFIFIKSVRERKQQVHIETVREQWSSEI